MKTILVSLPLYMYIMYNFPHGVTEQCSMAVQFKSVSMPLKKPACAPPHLLDVLGFVPIGSVSSSSTLQIFQEASHL